MKRNKLFPIVLVIFIVIGVFLVSCSNAPSGKLSIKQTGSNTIDVSYSFSNCTEAVLWKGESQDINVGSGSGSGVYRFNNLESNTEYLFVLENWINGHGVEIASVTCITEYK